MKFKFNVLTGVFDRVSGEGNYIQKFNPVTGKFNLVDDVDNYQQIINPLTGKFQLWAEGGKKYTKEVTGNGYIDLTDAVKNKLLELKAYGGCEQDLTPTPSTPVDIVCNNGVLKIKDKELPVGYVRVESIEFDGSMHYNTGEHLFGADSVKMTLSNSGSSGRNVFGCYTNTSATDNFSLYVYTNTTGQAYFRYGDDLYRPIFGTGTRTITFGNGGTTGFYSGNVTAQEQTFETSVNAYIGALPNSSSAKLTGTIYGNIEVSNNGIVRLKWIPCKRISDGVIGYYEVVNGNFLGPSGSGTPTAGAEDYSNLEVYVEGTKEKIGINIFSQENYLDAYCTNGGTITEHTTSRVFIVPCKPNTEYGFIFDNSNVSNPRCIVSGFTDEPTIGMRVQQNLYSSPNTEAKLHDTTFTTNNNINYLVFWLMYNKNDTATQEAVDKTILYETNNTATCEDLLGVGDYKDEQEILSGTVTRKVGIVILDGTETYSIVPSLCRETYNVLSSTFTNKMSDKVANKPVICSHFQSTNNNQTQINTIGQIAFNSSASYSKTCYFSVPTTITNNTEMQAYMSGLEHIIIIYPLETPTTETVVGQPLSIPSGNSKIEIVEGSIMDLPLSAKYLSTTE